MSTRRILLSLAHPDDESFGSGGLIARYVAEGAEVYLICATNGDVGTVSPEKMNGFSSVAELRLAELECASHLLGFKHIYTFGYRDSGMMGSETSQHPDCLWQAPQEQVTRRVVEVIREVKPQVIMTFNKYGGYGHPDHIAIHKATVEAFDRAGDPAYDTGQASYAPQKLYYGTFPTFILRFWLFMFRLRGQDPRKAGRNQDIDLLAIVENTEPASTMIDVGRYLALWDEANACHDSQGGGRFAPRLPMPLRRLLNGKQALTRVRPAPTGPGIDEQDVFAGVTL